MEARKRGGGFSSKETLRFSVGNGLAKCGGYPLLRLAAADVCCISQIAG